MEFTSQLFEWQAQQSGSWFFLLLPAELADLIRDSSGPRAGFGSVRVTAQVGRTTWQTSLFPDKPTGSYVLPVKKQVRIAEGIDSGDSITVQLELG